MNATQYSVGWLKQHGASEKSFGRALSGYLNDQAERVASEVQATFTPTPETVALVFDADAEHELLRPIVERNLASLGASAAADELRRLAPQKAAEDYREELEAFELPPEVVSSILGEVNESFAQPHWRAMQETTRRRIGDAITSGIQEKLSANAIARVIRESIGGMAANKRAKLIARTETTGALNAGHHAARERLTGLGLISGSRWLAIGDGDVRLTHSILDGTVASGRSPFSVGGFDAPYPGHFSLPAEERANCRCTTVSVLADDLEDGF